MKTNIATLIAFTQKKLHQNLKKKWHHFHLAQLSSKEFDLTKNSFERNKNENFSPEKLSPWYRFLHRHLTNFWSRIHSRLRLLIRGKFLIFAYLFYYFSLARLFQQKSEKIIIEPAIRPHFARNNFFFCFQCCRMCNFLYKNWHYRNY